MESGQVGVQVVHVEDELLSDMLVVMLEQTARYCARAPSQKSKTRSGSMNGATNRPHSDRKGSNLQTHSCVIATRALSRKSMTLTSMKGAMNRPHSDRRGSNLQTHSCVFASTDLRNHKCMMRVCETLTAFAQRHRERRPPKPQMHVACL